jgi:hypothetical protein
VTLEHFNFIRVFEFVPISCGHTEAWTATSMGLGFHQRQAIILPFSQRERFAGNNWIGRCSRVELAAVILENGICLGIWFDFALTCF